MEKIKSILSHGQDKETDAAQARHDTPTAAEFDRSTTGALTGEGSHLTDANKSAAPSAEHHPIYDQFTKGSNFSNTTNAPQPTFASAAASSPTDSTTLHPNQFRPAPHENMSNASIKSGVIGFPQGADDSHAARPNKNPFEQKQHGSNQPGAGGDLSGTKAGNRASDLQQSAAIGAGALGTGALAEHGSRSQPEASSHLAAGQTTQPNLQRQESDVGPDSGRSFPLAGGVAHQTPQTNTAASTRAPGAENEARLPQGAGRQGLAGAAAAATPTSVIPQNDGRIEANLHDTTAGQSAPEHHYGRDAAVGGGLGAAGAGAYEAAKRHQEEPAQSTNLQDRAVNQSAPEHHYGRDAAVAGGLGTAGIGAYEASKRHQAQPTQTTAQPAHPAAVAAAQAAVDEHGWTHDHQGLGHDYKGDPCGPDEEKSPAERGLLFTSGPHVTDTANRLDPKLHIPGEFPSPTPVEESNASSYLSSKPTTETNPSAFEETGLRHTGSLDQPQARSTEQPTSDHHYGRDAAVVGGLGAAGAGAYAAGKHHEKESAPASSATFPNEPNPYTKTPVDPRLGTPPRGGLTEQRFDPTTAPNRSPRNAALTGGAVGSSQASPKAREVSNEEFSSAGRDVKPDSQHHYGRDAALVGAGAATTAGLYASQRDAEPSSGPASSTIGPHSSNVANTLDPRVQPDPALQKHHHAAPTVEDPAPSTVGQHKSDVANIADPRVLPDPQKQKAVPKEEVHDPQHHYGRDAAVIGGAGALGAGAYAAGNHSQQSAQSQQPSTASEAAQSYGEHPMTQPSTAMNEQRYDPAARGNQTPGSTGATTAAPVAAQDQHHYGRDAALVGGAGALGTGAYAATHDHPQSAQGYQQPSALASSQVAPQSGTYPQAPVTTGTGTSTGTATTAPVAAQDQHHYGRDAAVVGGAGALGAGAYAATRDHPQSVQGYQQPSTIVSQSGTYPPQDPSLKEDHTKRNAALGTGAVAATGAGAYGLSQKDAQKEQERQLKEQQKASEKAAAAEKKHAKEQQGRESPPGKEKKHRILTFLNKKDKDPSRRESGESSPRKSRDSPRHSRDYATGAAGVGAAGVGAAALAEDDHDGRHLAEKNGRHVLHKEPPKDHPAYDTHPHEPVGLGKHEHVGTDGPIGDPNLISGDHQTRAGVYGAHPISDVTGGHHTVTEPHTGLPMNVEKYGDGHGGTDGSRTIVGAHEGEGQATNWDNIKKNDTIF